jgi:hypothetical protein
MDMHEITSDGRRKKLTVTLPELIFIAATRGAIGVGIGLMLANRLTERQRKAIGLPLFIGGVLSTIPIALHVFSKKEKGDDFPEQS